MSSEEQPIDEGLRRGEERRGLLYCIRDARVGRPCLYKLVGQSHAVDAFDCEMTHEGGGEARIQTHTEGGDGGLILGLLST